MPTGGGRVPAEGGRVTAGGGRGPAGRGAGHVENNIIEANNGGIDGDSLLDLGLSLVGFEDRLDAAVKLKLRRLLATTKCSTRTTKSNHRAIPTP